MTVVLILSFDQSLLKKQTDYINLKLNLKHRLTETRGYNLQSKYTNTMPKFNMCIIIQPHLIKYILD